jgi:signal transduction histidine kinase
MSLKILIVFFAVLTSLIFLGLIITIIILNSNFNKTYKKQDEKFKVEKNNLKLQISETEINSKEEERERIASNFHDDINPLFAALKHQLLLFNSNAKEQRKNYDQNKQISYLIDKIIEQQNAAIGNVNLRVQTIGQLSYAIQEYLNCLNHFKIIFDTEITVKKTLKAEIFTNLYSIFLEQIHNIMKHEVINELNVHLKMDDSSFDLMFKHDGIGLTNEQFQNSIRLKEGRGLSSIQSRLTYTGAKMELMSLNGGAIVHITLPLKNV